MKNDSEWNKDNVIAMGFDKFKAVYEGYVNNPLLFGAYKKKSEAQLQSLFKEITGKEVKEPQSINENKITKDEL